MAEEMANGGYDATQDDDNEMEFWSNAHYVWNYEPYTNYESCYITYWRTPGLDPSIHQLCPT